MRGLIRYLVETREGRTENVHTDPHVISGDDHLVAWHGSEVLNLDAAGEISAYLEEPRKLYGTEVRTKVWKADPETGERRPDLVVDPDTGRRVQRYRDEHVWHCSLSLRASEGPLSDQKWDAVARDFMDKMGFTEAAGKAPCRWVAIHHGTSAAGNDHIHIAASMVREDGTRWEGRFRDFRTAQQVARELEVKHGLERVEGREQGTAARGEQRAETERAARSGATSTVPKELAHRIRSAAVASTGEAEWIRRLRDSGVVVKPFYAKGTTDVVAGYRAAVKGGAGEKLVFYGGGKLGKDLSLPRLREGWAAPSIEQAEEISGEWQAAFRGQPPTTKKGRERSPLATTAPDVAADRLGAFSERLRALPLDDRAGWAVGARDVSGALSAWAAFDKTNSQELRTAAEVVGRSAQLRRRAVAPRPPTAASGMATAFLFAAARGEDRNKIKAAALLAQLVSAVGALRDYHRELGHLRHVQALEQDVLARLQKLPLPGYRPAQLSAQEERAWTAQQVARQGQAAQGEPARTPGSPLPRPLTPKPEQRIPSTHKGDRDDRSR
ncbi:relaxase/mobilization nuclease domain-containing protein [Nocardioides sp. Root140]|uniref:relaxase/mobilization nuclease domain-containing protein n=1 Tax=Nocardioides sp. Root140 TaxID=1736460 RepID=UPI0012E37DF6|nr:relaxase/mobilization nuclease domain-containing protein [Nocardioides sp. Root140]